MADARKIGAVEIDRLYDFLDGLQASDYTIDPRQYLALSDLLMALIARGDSLDVLPLKTLIAPLICSTPVEQQDFYQRFDRWYPMLRPARQAVLPALPSQPKRRWLFPIINRTTVIWITVVIAAIRLIIWVISNLPVINSNVLFYGVIVAFVGLLGWFGWRLWVHQYITRELANQEPVYTKVPVKAYEQDIMPVMQFKPIVSALRKRTQVPSSVVDVDRTIENALNRDNWLEIVFRQRQVMPEYVVLIDRKSRLDQQARFVQEVLAKLAADGVWLHQYEFSGDPRICFPLDRKDTPLRLKDLQSRHLDARLLIFSGMNELINPLTGLLHDWLENLSHWQERAILTPDKLQKFLHEELQSRDFAVLPMTFDGLASLVRAFESDNAPLLTNGGAGLPAQLTERPMRWTGRDAPPNAEVKALVSDVKDYLHENGFYWLCATAVYPELRWELTLHLGSALKDDLGQSLLNPDLLIRLSRLPWFRFGYMPDWIRLALVESFSGQQKILVREVLIGLLSSVYQGQEFDLIFSRKSDTSLKSSIQRFLRALKQISPAESLLQDHIFIDFIIKRQNKKLSIALPESVRKVLTEVTKSESEIHTKPTTLDQNGMSVIWDYFRRLWLVYRGRKNLAEPYIFSSHEVISPAFFFNVSYLNQGVYLNLHPTLYAVCVFADGSRKRFDEGGLIIPFPSGKCTLHYVDKTDRQSDLLKVTENTLDTARITLAFEIIYRVSDPIKVFDVQKPVETLFSQVQADLKEYIRTRLYEDLIGNDDNQVIDSGLVAKYIKQQHSAQYPMSQVFTIIDVVVQEKEGDPVFIKKRKSYKSQVVDGKTEMKIQNPSKEIASQEEEMDQQKNESDVEQSAIRQKISIQEMEIQKMRDAWQQAQDNWKQKQAKWLRSMDAVENALKSPYIRDQQVGEILSEIIDELKNLTETDVESDVNVKNDSWKMKEEKWLRSMDAIESALKSPYIRDQQVGEIVSALIDELRSLSKTDVESDIDVKNDSWKMKQEKWLRSMDAIESAFKSPYIRDQQVGEIIGALIDELRSLSKTDVESDIDLKYDSLKMKQAKWLRAMDAIDSALKSPYLRDQQVEGIVSEIYDELRSLSETDVESDIPDINPDVKNDSVKNDSDNLDKLTETLFSMLDRRKPKE